MSLPDPHAPLRGGLPLSSRGARDLEHLERNSACDAHTLMVSIGAHPADVARLLNVPAEEGQSEHALSHGNTFELRNLDGGAAAILDLYRSVGILGIPHAKVKIFDPLPPAPPRTETVRYRRWELIRRRRALHTAKLIRDRWQGDPTAPNMIVHPGLTLDVFGHVTLVPDVLVAAEVDRLFWPADLKSFADLYGRTDQASLRAARRQLAVYTLALSEIASSLPGFDERLHGRQLERADLILSKPGSYRPSLVRETVGGEMEVIASRLESLPGRLAAIVGRMAAAGHRALDSEAALLAAGITFSSECSAFCPMHRRCERLARADGRPEVVDPRAPQILGAVDSLHRYRRLMHGQVQPHDADERQLRDTHQGYLDAFQSATGI
jgi:hypothetical protein